MMPTHGGAWGFVPGEFPLLAVSEVKCNSKFRMRKVPQGTGCAISELVGT